MKTIGIFPASGRLATSTLTHLLQPSSSSSSPSSTSPPFSLILISRKPSKLPPTLTALLPPTTVLRTASYESPPEDLAAAFAGVDVLLLVSYPSPAHEYRSSVQLPALTAAHAAGVRHVFYSSLAFALPDRDVSKAVVMRAHLDSEECLRELGGIDGRFTWTSLREGLYQESLFMYTAHWDAQQKKPTEVCIPHDGSGPGVPWAARDDFGEATARLMAQYMASPSAFPYKDTIVPLTGPRSWTLAETVAAMGRAAGVDGDLTIRQVSVDEYARQEHVLAFFGGDPERAREWATVWAAIAAGETYHQGGELEEILGRKPVGLEDRLREMAEAKTKR